MSDQKDDGEFEAFRSDPQKKPAVRSFVVSRAAARDDPYATERALVCMAVRRATTPAWRRRILGAAGLALVVRVPDVSWVAPVENVVGATADWAAVHRVTSAPRPRAGEDPERALVNALADGGRVLGVAPDLAWLPPALLAAADLLVELQAPDAAALSTVIRAIAAEGSPDPDGPPDGSGLDFHDLVAAIRRSSTPAQCHARLDAARAVRRARGPDVPDAPSLKELHGYGEAMAWAQGLAAELAAWRAGKIPFPAGSARAVLAGPPGTGKTSLVRALAKTANLPLVATSVAQWFASGPGYLDSVIKSIDAVFQEASLRRPCVVLLDEIDALPDRAAMSERDRVWWTTVVTHVLLLLDGAASQSTRDLVIVGCTNHAARLDAALTRPGRLERVIEVLPPEDPSERERIVRSLLAGELADEDLTIVALVTAGATGAILAALVRDARRRARSAGRALEAADLLAEAMPPTKRPADEERRYAVHECGHAVAAVALGIEVRLVSLVETATARASVHMSPWRAGVVTRADCERRVVVMLGGMAAEQAVYGDRSMGAGGSETSDLALATEILTAMHSAYGMGERLSYTPSRSGWPDTHVAALVERDMQRLYRQALETVAERADTVTRLAGLLVARRFLTGAEVRAACRDAGATLPAKRRGDATRPADEGDARLDGDGPGAIRGAAGARPRTPTPGARRPAWTTPPAGRDAPAGTHPVRARPGRPRRILHPQGFGPCPQSTTPPPPSASSTARSSATPSRSTAFATPSPRPSSPAPARAA